MFEKWIAIMMVGFCVCAFGVVVVDSWQKEETKRVELQLQIEQLRASGNVEND
jgi:hypothetical protein